MIIEIRIENGKDIDHIGCKCGLYEL